MTVHRARRRTRAIGALSGLLLVAACETTRAPAPRPPRAPPPPAAVPTRLVVVTKPASPHQPLYDFVKKLLVDEYAPGALKSRLLGWDAQRELARLEQGFEQNPRLDQRQRRRLLYEIFRAPRDIHTGIGFKDARAVWLGVHLLRASDGSYRVAWHDDARTPGVALARGDVVEAIDGVAISSSISAVTRDTLYRGTPAFDQAFAEWFLVMRGEDVWPTIPAAGAIAKLRVRTGKNKVAREVSLPWLDADKSPPGERCPFWGKTKKGYLPDLGAVVWRAGEDAQYPSYVFAARGATWGYVRFHSYALESAARVRALEEWKQAIAAFKKHQVKGLVIDQLGNGGGNFLFAYALFSRLTEEPLRTPIQHFLARGGRQVVGFGDARFFSEQLTLLKKVESDADAEAFLAKYPLFSAVDYMPKNAASVRSFERFFTSLGELARSEPGLTEPRASLEGEIAPHPDGLRFTGPIVVLIDGLNISAAEYAAAALSDSGRARLIGATTSGAGGDQREYRLDRICGQAAENPFRPCLPAAVAAELAPLGVRSLSHTVTVGRRVDSAGNATGYIENQGVAPARELSISGRDLTEKFRDFRASIVDELVALSRS